MGENFSETQIVQEGQYSFPHHYVPQYKGGFSTSVYSGFGINYVSTIEFLFTRLDDIEFISLADIGAGDGRLVKELSEQYPDKKVSGIDYSQRAIYLAKGLNPSLNFIKADIIQDDLNKKFDVLTLIEVFEHIPPEICDDFVYALHNLLNDKGILLITVPHKNKLVSKKHYQHFSSGSLKEYFVKQFYVEEEIFFEKKNWRLFFIRKFLKNKLFLLNNRSMLNCLYKSYKKHCFYTVEEKCGRIFLKLRKK